MKINNLFYALLFLSLFIAPLDICAVEHGKVEASITQLNIHIANLENIHIYFTQVIGEYAKEKRGYSKGDYYWDICDWAISTSNHCEEVLRLYHKCECSNPEATVLVDKILRHASWRLSSNIKDIYRNLHDYDPYKLRVNVENMVSEIEAIKELLNSLQ